MRPQNMLRASLLAAGLTAPLAFASPSYAAVVITVDQSTQRMLVAVDGSTRYDWPVSTGRPGFGTPDGRFKPNRMEVMHYSNEYEEAPMPHSIFFDMHGHAIHGFSDTPHLGMAVSHGCVRLAPPNAAVLFNLVKQEGMAGTSVIITGRAPRSGPLVARRQAPNQRTASQPPAQPYGPPPGYDGRSYYGDDQQAYGPPPGYDQYRRPNFPQQPPPAYAGPAYNQPYGGQTYYRQRQPYYQQPSYQQPQYGGPFPY